MVEKKPLKIDFLIHPGYLLKAQPERGFIIEKQKQLEADWLRRAELHSQGDFAYLVYCSAFTSNDWNNMKDMDPRDLNFAQIQENTRILLLKSLYGNRSQFLARTPGDSGVYDDFRSLRNINSLNCLRHYPESSVDEVNIFGEHGDWCVKAAFEILRLKGLNPLIKYDLCTSNVDIRKWDETLTFYELQEQARLAFRWSNFMKTIIAGVNARIPKLGL